MRLLTHNYLQSNVKGTTKGYPLIIEATEVITEESPVDSQLLTKLVSKLDYAVLVGAAKQLNNTPTVDLPELPETLPEQPLTDELLIQTLHTILMDVHIVEGHLVCPDTGRKFPIKEGIPNMILHEDEV
jgi:multifunctional methyltransferase subunit TRM112